MMEIIEGIRTMELEWWMWVIVVVVVLIIIRVAAPVIAGIVLAIIAALAGVVWLFCHVLEWFLEKIERIRRR